MRIRCVAEFPTLEQSAKLGSLFTGGRQSFGVTVGMEYLVFGMRFIGSAILVDVAQEFDQLYPIPLDLFEITDPRIPSLWEARRQGNGALFLWPPSFFAREFYHEDLFEQVPSVVEDFARVRRRLELESTLGET